MEKKDTIYVILLAFSLFSISLMLFSQGITSLSVTLRDGNNVAVQVPNLFPLTQVLGMLFMSSIATFCLTMLTQDILFLRNYNLSPDKHEDVSVLYNANNPVNPDPLVTMEVAQPPQSLQSDQEQKKLIATKILEGDSRKLYKIIAEKEELLQSDLVLESGFSKVKVSRTLKKLEDKSLIERKPYGNTNKIILSK
ncbi:hypothetical protein V7O62_02350 [Methanolobus sp. ZRKC2]|uniref:helix-turn-helix transcriptional regulator n=1 Tax=Methanolobus sp. ZRKC2 TaxID=3125783 RepID=UPI00324BB79E